MLFVGIGREISEGGVGSLFVVGDEPVMDDFTDFTQTGKEMCIEHFAPQAAVEAFDVGILSWFAWLDVMEADVVPFTPCHQFRGNEFWTIIHSNLLGQRMAVLELFQNTDDAFRR